MVQTQPRRKQDKSGYLAEDTIAAIATPLGGAVAIVRLSGPESLSVLEKLCGYPVQEKHAPRTLIRQILKSPEGELLDDALVAYFRAPKSFTGEDSGELHIHGGAFIAAKLMETLGRLGVRQALPGEFSFRAVRNGKMSLSQAEATADLISASNEGAVSMALEKLSGSQGALIRDLAEALRNLAVLGEVGIDFSDQDIDEVSLPNLVRRVQPILDRLDLLARSYQRGSWIQEGVRVAFIGLPNAGKSSFFNSLLGEDRSIVSEIAGTTRDVVRERLTLRGKASSVTLRLEDTAGLREASDQIEKMGIERSHKAAREAELLILVVDGLSGREDFERLWEQWLKLGQPAEKTLGIVTKLDLMGGEHRKALESSLRPFNVKTWSYTSATRGTGISESAEAIAEFCEKWTHRDQGEVLLTRLDHVQAVQQAVENLRRAQAAPELDLFASDLRQALHALGPLIGDTVPDDILGRIFSEFCIGK